jgi:hypothetical protein
VNCGTVALTTIHVVPLAELPVQACKPDPHRAGTAGADRRHRQPVDERRETAASVVELHVHLPPGAMNSRYGVWPPP